MGQPLSTAPWWVLQAREEGQRCLGPWLRLSRGPGELLGAGRGVLQPHAALPLLPRASRDRPAKRGSVWEQPLLVLSWDGALPVQGLAGTGCVCVLEESSSELCGYQLSPRVRGGALLGGSALLR